LKDLDGFGWIWDVAESQAIQLHVGKNMPALPTQWMLLGKSTSLKPAAGNFHIIPGFA